ncbi:MAG: fused MFS/spermidine synthase [Desulforhopalus sp.]|nr:fused MFS/spermidine synthase [Desulforhopalus sp.]
MKHDRMPPPPGFLQTAVFTCAILLSAFLLFWSQPLFARMILPILGGAAAVWTTSMLFFQLSLLAGYLYAHCSSRYLAVRQQILLHLVLLLAAGGTLPFYINGNRAGTLIPVDFPAFGVLSLAALTVGPPFFAVSATAPMLQRWFSRTSHRHRENPYFLYAASNLGSMAALIVFPVALEPLLGVERQTMIWAFGYFVLFWLLLVTGLVTLRGQALGSGAGMYQSAAALVLPAGKISATQRLSWIFLAFLPSSMMLGLTSHVTVDIAPVSMFWVLPLAIYLLSFVLVFSRFKTFVPNRLLAAIIVLCTVVLLGMKFTGNDRTLSTAELAVLLHLTLFFSSAWLLHGYLSSNRPPPAQLTEYYLWLAFGGMLGGLFNALLAPVIFSQIYEYFVVVLAVFSIASQVLVGRPRQAAASSGPQPAGMVMVFLVLLCVFVVADVVLRRPITPETQRGFAAGSVVLIIVAGGLAFRRPKGSTIGLALLVFTFGLIGNYLVLTVGHGNLLLDRTFYGAFKVRLKKDRDGTPYHLFIHGSTRHNLQRFGDDPLVNQEPLMYFHRQANIGHALTALKSHLARPMHLGFVGLGAGAMAAYVDYGDTATFYEIDPKVAAMAGDRRYFTYVGDARGKIGITVGDARLRLQQSADASYDLLLIDAFASDAIPVHLLTAEAVAMYLRKIKDDGMLLFHLSNRYLDLVRVLQGLVLPDGYVLCYASQTDVDRPAGLSGRIPGIFSHSQVALIARESALPAEITDAPRWRRLGHDPDFSPWTDDFSNVFGVLRIF